MFDGQLAGHDGSLAAISILDDLQEIAALLGSQWAEPEVVQDQDDDAGEGFQKPGVPAIAARQAKSIEQPRHALIEHGAVVPAGLVTERAGEPTLADAGWPADQ